MYKNLYRDLKNITVIRIVDDFGKEALNNIECRCLSCIDLFFRVSREIKKRDLDV
jgi:hypothetical protein